MKKVNWSDLSQICTYFFLLHLHSCCSGYPIGFHFECKPNELWSNVAKCTIYESNVLSHSKVKCWIVSKMEYNLNCVYLNREEMGRLSQETNWYCPQFIEQIFPGKFLPAISPTKHDFYTFVMQIFTCPLFSEEISDLPIYEWDPDINFYTGIHSSVGNNCKYYMEDDFNGMIQRQHSIADNDAVILPS